MEASCGTRSELKCILDKCEVIVDNVVIDVCARREGGEVARGEVDVGWGSLMSRADKVDVPFDLWRECLEDLVSRQCMCQQ